MFEYEIKHKTSNERDFIYGYSRMDAWKRCKWLNRDEWDIIGCWYID